MPEHTCSICGREGLFISSFLGLCLSCIRSGNGEVKERIAAVHGRSRGKFGLPRLPPQDPVGAPCHICANECQIAPGQLGYCGLRTSQDGKLIHLSGTRSKGKLSWYYDALPTNCVADWVCPGGTGAGFPRYANSPGAEVGYKNLAVFYAACSFDCLFCQNWHFRERTSSRQTISAAELASRVDARTSCICYFGGDPGPQMPHALATSRIALKRAREEGRTLRICWETNGGVSRRLLEAAAAMSLESGGCIKFDLKAFAERLHYALTGNSNRQTLDNFQHLAGLIHQRPQPPFLVASTLLVPGYIDAEEVSEIAHFIASLDRDIPYSLLAFYPHFEMSDLPATSRSQALECVQAATEAGFTRVHIGNLHLLT